MTTSLPLTPSTGRPAGGAAARPRVIGMLGGMS